MARSRSPSPFIPPPPNVLNTGGGGGAGGGGVSPAGANAGRVIPEWSPNSFPYGPSQLHPAGYTPHMRPDAYPMPGMDYPPHGGGRPARAGYRDPTDGFSEDWVGFGNGPQWGSAFAGPQNLPQANRTSPWMRNAPMPGILHALPPFKLSRE